MSKEQYFRNNNDGSYTISSPRGSMLTMWLHKDNSEYSTLTISHPAPEHKDFDELLENELDREDALPVALNFAKQFPKGHIASIRIVDEKDNSDQTFDIVGPNSLEAQKNNV